MALSRVALWTAAGVLLILSTPVPALFHSIGPYDDRAWWEAIVGTLIGVTGGCLLLSSVPVVGRELGRRTISVQQGVSREPRTSTPAQA